MKDCVLYIDDEKENLESFNIALWMHYDISVAQNTKDAREILKKKDIKVVITDQRMPEETGLEFVNNIYNDYPDLIYMVLTGYTDIEVVIEAINHGNIYRFMTKPWDLQEMKQSIENALETYNLRKKNEGLLEELKNKNEELRKSEYKFRNIFNSSLDSITIINASGDILEVNAITCFTTGYTRDELLKSKFVEVFPKEQRKKINNWLEKLYEKGEIFFEAYYLNKSEKKIHLDVIAKEIDYLGGKAFLIVARDISEKKNYSRE
jgi:PAS domain S-box-containing protein